MRNLPYGWHGSACRRDGCLTTNEGEVMQTAIEKRVITIDGADTNYWDFACECGYLFEGAPTKKIATTRKEQHLTEHETGEPAPPKAELLGTPQEVDAAERIARAFEQRRGMSDRVGGEER